MEEVAVGLYVGITVKDENYRLSITCEWSVTGFPKNV